MEPPTGEVTFLFTDVQGSTAAWEEHAESMAGAVAEHDRRVSESVAAHDGYVFTTAGDSFAVAFADPSGALAASVAVQERLSEPAAGPEIRVRMALHTGIAYERDGDYFGPVVNRCARLMSAAHGGQVLVSGTTARLVAGRIGADVRLIDLGEHQLKDLSLPEHVYQVAHPSLEEQFPPLRTVDAARSNLPVQLTSFIGRERELADVTDLVAASRLVTLAGPGGSGKTRLAMQVAADLVGESADSVTLAELAPITDPDLVGDTVAATFGAQAVPGRPVAESIVAKIGDRNVLLVIDNCEHLLEPVAELVGALLALSSTLTVVATSQAPLGIAGEIVYRVPPLAVPQNTVTVEDATRCDAVALFIERAAVAKPSFALTSENLAAVVDICRRLDGIPLALELAAARVSVLTPQQIAQRLGERFRLLARGPRLADERHRTLHAAIDWSHDLLEDAEKVLFRRCGAFSGSFELDAAEAVCVGDQVDEYEVLDLVAALVDKSLLVVDHLADRARYRLLESMRDYARDRLADSGDGPAVTAAHATWFARHAEALQQMYRGGRLADALTALRLDRDNFRAALEFGLDNDVEPAGRIIGGIGYLWYADGAFREGIDWCERLFSLDPDLPPELMASALHSFGTVLGSWAEPEAGAEILEREVALRRRLDDPVRLAAALNNLGTAYNDVGRRESGDAALHEAVDLYRAGGRSAAISLVSLAWAAMNNGDYEAALGYCEQTRAEAQHADDAYDLALAAAATGCCTLHLGRLVDARSHLEEASTRFSDLGVPPGVQEAEINLALVDRAEGLAVDAARRLEIFLDDPDTHWLQAGKYWAIQITASLVDDPTLATDLLDVAEAYYEQTADGSSARPAWVGADLADTRRRLDDVTAGDTHRRAAAPVDDAISLARAALVALVDRACITVQPDGPATSSPDKPGGSTP